MFIKTTSFTVLISLEYLISPLVNYLKIQLKPDLLCLKCFLNRPFKSVKFKKTNNYLYFTAQQQLWKDE